MNNDLISITKLNELFSKKIDEERKTNKVTLDSGYRWSSCSRCRSSITFISSLLLIIWMTLKMN